MQTSHSALNLFALFPVPKNGDVPSKSQNQTSGTSQKWMNTELEFTKAHFREIPYCKQMRKQKILYSHHM